MGLSGKIPLFAGMILLLALHSWGADFRDISWGASESDIREKETAQFISEALPLEDLKLLVFADTMAGLDALVVYVLAQGKLVHSKYVFYEDHADPDLFVGDFERIESVLKEKYGEPGEEGEFWLNEPQEMSRGEAVSEGELLLITRRDTPETAYIHLLMGEDREITHEVDYLSKELIGLEAELLRKAEEEDGEEGI